MKKIKTKTKISGIVDNSSMGISVNGIADSDMQISKVTEKTLRKGMSHSAFFTLVSGVAMTGNSKWMLTITEDCKIVYEFKSGSGGVTFLNVTGNPTKLMRGSNDIPVLLKDKEYSKNAALNTFMYANRILYAILEFVPDMEFDWGVDKKRLLEGDINISRFQLAWYSGDLKNRRNDILRFLRVCYGGLDATKGRVDNLGSGIGINARLWDNHEGNFTLEKRAGKSKMFSITFYSKDDEPDYEGSDKEKSRLCNLIRFDCTLMSYFLELNGLKTVRGLEQKYFEVCEKQGYDIGFVRWLADEIYSKINFQYIVKLNLKEYKESLKKLESIIGGKSPNEEKLVRHWIEYGDNLSSDLAKTIGVNYKNYASFVHSLRDKTGIDVEINRSFHEAVLFNRMISHLTREERADLLMSSSNNQKIDILENLQSREERLKDIHDIIFSKSASIKRLVPKSMRYQDFWAYKTMREIAAKTGA